MANFNKMVSEMRNIFLSGRTRSLDWRLNQLKGLLQLLEENQDKMCEALYKDLHKHKGEACLMDLMICKNDVADALNNLRDWARPKQVGKSLVNKMDSAYIRYEPYGVSLIIGTWNYPIQMVLLPLVGAIAAGNCCIMKPSEVAEHSAKLVEELVPKYLDRESIRVVNGSVPETTALLAERFDIIFYTGNTTVAKIVMTAAAKYLTPVVLELGGKSPVYIDSGVDLDVVARRLAWGKYANAGQTCIAPDYVMCTPEIQDKLIEKLKKVIEEFYTNNPKTSDSYGRVVNQRHFQRLRKMLEGGNIVIGGDMDESQNYISPTVLRDSKLTDNIMQEEVFGPLLAIMPVRDHVEAVSIINDREKPLAMYVFSNRKEVVQLFREHTSSGGFLVNDTVVHVGVSTLPFGGVGHSGMGSYHGKFSFDAFSHKRACLEKNLGLESVNSLRYPPYSEKKLSWLEWMIMKKPRRSGILSFFPFIILGAVLAVLFKKPLESALQKIEL